ncbi:MAG: esterase/lipase family protein [Myxococcota bacterium]
MHASAPLPVVLVHGIFDRKAKMDAIARRLERDNRLCHAFDLVPPDGRAHILEYARQVGREVDAILSKTGADRVDVVGMSMGAVVLRSWIMLLRGWRRTRRFVSLAGPHHGTATAYLSKLPAAGDLRPGSALLGRLNSRPVRWNGVGVFTFWTPFDLMVVPGRSGRLEGATVDRSFPVLLHPLMAYDRKVLDAVADALTAG